MLRQRVDSRRRVREQRTSPPVHEPGKVEQRQFVHRRGNHMSLRTAVAVLGASLLCVGLAGAQQPAPAFPTPSAPYPLDGVPEKMPFDVPYGPPISLDKAQAAIAAAIAESKKHDWKEIIAVVDSGGNLVALQRMDGGQLAGATIAEHKARASVLFRRDTKAFETGIQQGGFLYLLTLD